MALDFVGGLPWLIKFSELAGIEELSSQISSHKQGYPSLLRDQNETYSGCLKYEAKRTLEQFGNERKEGMSHKFKKIIFSFFISFFLSTYKSCLMVMIFGSQFTLSPGLSSLNYTLPISFDTVESLKKKACIGAFACFPIAFTTHRQLIKSFLLSAVSSLSDLSTLPRHKLLQSFLSSHP